MDDVHNKDSIYCNAASSEIFGLRLQCRLNAVVVAYPHKLHAGMQFGLSASFYRTSCSVLNVHLVEGNITMYVTTVFYHFNGKFLVMGMRLY